MRLIDRIDIALKAAGSTRAILAENLGLTAQSFHRLARREGSTMRCENVARVARELHCDLYWLCTGEGGEYVPESHKHEHSLLARDVAGWLDAMPDHDRWRAFALVYQMTRGNWPEFPAAQLLPDTCAPEHPPMSSHPAKTPPQKHP
jgi:hypothetical protein